MSAIKSYLVAMDTLEKSMRAQVDALEEVYDALGHDCHGHTGAEEVQDAGDALFQAYSEAATVFRAKIRAQLEVSCTNELQQALDGLTRANKASNATKALDALLPAPSVKHKFCSICFTPLTSSSVTCQCPPPPTTTKPAPAPTVAGTASIRTRTQ
jgi:hypothetical protein